MFFVFKAIFLLFILSNILFAYLDPSTGSLLLSSIVAIFASLLFLLKGIVYKTIPIIKSGRIKTINTTKTNSDIKSSTSDYGLVIYNESKHYYNVFKPIMDYLDSINYPYTYFTSSKDDFAFSRKNKDCVCLEYIGDSNSNHAYSKLNTLKADIVLMTTPQLDVLQIKRSKWVKHYCHIIHSLPHVDIYEIFALDYFDSVFTNSPIHTDFIHKVESIRNLKPKQIKITGCTYLDVLQDKLNKINKNEVIDNISLDSNVIKRYFNDSKDVILLSPSWGRESLLHKYGMDIIKPLAESEFNIIIRPHPQTIISNKSLLDSLKSQTKEFLNVKWDTNVDNIYSMQEASIMIGDFSGVIFDFICLFNKPVVTMEFKFNKIGYDIEDTGEEIWVENILKQISLVANDVSDILNIVRKAFELDLKMIDNRIKIKELLWHFQGNGGVKSANELIKIHKVILEESLGDNLDTYKGLVKLEYILKEIRD